MNDNEDSHQQPCFEFQVFADYFVGELLGAGVDDADAAAREVAGSFAGRFPATRFHDGIV